MGAPLLHVAQLNAHLLAALKSVTSSLEQTIPSLPSLGAREAVASMVVTAKQIITIAEDA